ncbi:protocadherin Fat 4-like isoform X2 [Pomacea canaliculata]|nr:protocadherin Fat 4-like isoform X2 [Pomacea canaliculata]
MTVTGQEVILRPIVALWFTALVVLPVVSVLPPEWVTGSAYSVRVFENATVGTTLSTISAKSDPSNTNKSVTFLLPDLSAKLVNLSDAYNSAPDIWSAQVILAAQLDSDYEPSVRYLYFEAQDEVGTKSSTSLTLNILDVNDNPPSFQRLPYDVSVPENLPVGSILPILVTASDPDIGIGGIVNMSCVFPDELSETFMTEGVFFAINISLKAPLDFETRSFYSFPVVAQDPEGLNATANVRVTVTDVQDTPPFFLLDSYRAAVLENQAVGTSIIKVSAEDGDRNPQNDIRYSIVRGNTDFFAVDSVTGVITSLVVLDRDNETMVGKDGFFDLVVQANETDDVQPQLGNTTREAAVVVVVLDDNDNPPTFKSSAPYTAFLREDVANDTLVYFEGEGYIFVSDADQGQNSHFNLTVERGGVPWPALVPTPSDVVQEALVLLRVRNSADIREEAGKHINIQLVAREVSTSQRFSSTANIIIAVEANPEVTTTPAPSSGYDVTAPDIVVFVIGFLVVFNIVTTVLIICFMRRGGRPPREGQAKG